MFGKNIVKFIKGVMIFEVIKLNVIVNKIIFFWFLDLLFFDIRLVYLDIYYWWDKKFGLVCNGDVFVVLVVLFNFKFVFGCFFEVVGEYCVCLFKIWLNVIIFK